MLDFSPVRAGRRTMADLVKGLSVDDLYILTDEMIDRQLELIAGCDDTDVIFVPHDPTAEDTYASNAADVNLPWTLGHVIVHTTASAEESAFLAAEMARGIVREGRSRYETPWETVTTIAQCRRRLEESRRMRLAMLDVWPDEPKLDVTVRYGPAGLPLNAIGRFVRGLYHDDSHLGQIEEIIRQAHAARECVA